MSENTVPTTTAEVMETDAEMVSKLRDRLWELVDELGSLDPLERLQAALKFATYARNELCRDNGIDILHDLLDPLCEEPEAA